MRSNLAPTRIMFFGGSYSSDSYSDIYSPDFLTVLTNWDARLVLISYSSVLDTFFGKLPTVSGLSSSI